MGNNSISENERILVVVDQQNIIHIDPNTVVTNDGEITSRLVDHEEIANNDYTLSVTSYVKAEDTREVIDITKLNDEIKEIVARQQELRAQIDAIVADLEGN